MYTESQSLEMKRHFHFDLTYLLLAPRSSDKAKSRKYRYAMGNAQRTEALTGEERLQRIARIGLELARTIKSPEH